MKKRTSLFKISAHELRAGFSPKQLIAIAVIALLPLFSARRWLSLSPERATIGDYFMQYFLGAQPFEHLSKDNVFPVIWLLEVTIMLLVNMNFTSGSFSFYGFQTIVRSGSRRRWWGAKCISLALCCAIEIIVLYAVIALLALAFGAGSTLKIAASELAGGQSALWLLLLPALTFMALNALQSLMSLFVKPAIGFFITLCVPIASVYFSTPALIGNCLMALRMQPFSPGGLSPAQGIAANVVVIAAAVTAGMVRVSRVNFI